MTITAISTMKASSDVTNLIIDTAEVLNLQQMGAKPIRLNRGTNKLRVGRGVFGLASRNRVTVTADTQGSVVITREDKDGNWPDPSLLNVSADGAADLHDFFGGMGEVV